ncbi:hypothetical protein Tco_0826407 [Tanacetum coccineum]
MVKFDGTPMRSEFTLEREKTIHEENIHNLFTKTTPSSSAAFNAPVTFPLRYIGGVTPAQQAQSVSPIVQTAALPGSTGPTVTSGQETTLPHDFTAGMLHDPATGACNMDTGSDVLCRLVSNNFISCNKEKPPFLCHACQLGKHVRLPFVSSDTVVTSCFDIIHSDV